MQMLTKEKTLIYSEKLCDEVLTFDRYWAWWKCLKKTWESYLLIYYLIMDYLNETLTNKLIVFIKITKFDYSDFEALQG